MPISKLLCAEIFTTTISLVQAEPPSLLFVQFNKALFTVTRLVNLPRNNISGGIVDFLNVDVIVTVRVVQQVEFVFCFGIAQTTQHLFGTLH